ncbi:hypothetical protein BHE74_00050514 [Ensete ventricosum]|nr:hypothetical protein BHE74_00050514 [Ensete ventricosum]
MVPRNAECSPPNLLLLSPAYCCCCYPCSSTRCFPEAGPAIDCFPVATFPSVTPPLLSSLPVAPTLMMPSAKCKERERESESSRSYRGGGDPRSQTPALHMIMSTIIQAFVLQ